MASRMLKRPSSARRNIKQETFSSFVSATRLRRVQSILHAGNGDASERADAILCILGIDGRYNDGSRQLMDYLLFNFFDSRKTEIERSGYPEETIDDMLFLIRRDRVDIYCNPVNYLYLLPYVAHWRNLRIHCMTEEDYEDDEAAEEFKITSFITMVQGCRCVGIPFSGPAQSSKFDYMMIEKWPIIQAFAFEGYGGGGFFTMKHKVIDLGEQIEMMYHDLDPVSLEAVVTEQLPLFSGQWKTMMTVVESAGPTGLPALTEGRIAETLWSYFNHGRVGSAKKKTRPGVKRPFVLLGCHSDKASMEKSNLGVTLRDIPAQNAGVGDSLATHVVCQAVSPRGPLSCSRTYFFTTGVAPHPVSASPAEPRPTDTDLSLLTHAYGACVKAVYAAIEAFSTSLDVKQATSEAYNTLKDYCGQFETSALLTHVSDKANVEIFIEAHDNNNAVDLHEGHPSYRVKRATVNVYELPSSRVRGQHLGSVSFGESFMNSSVNVQRPDGSRILDAERCVLTRQIPIYVNWPYHPTDSTAVAAVQSSLTKDHVLGKQLISGDQAILLSELTEESLNDGNLHVFDNGIIYTSTHVGTVVLPKSQMASIYFYDGESSSEVAFLILRYREAYAGFLPYHLRSPLQRLILAFAPRSKAYKKLFSDVFPVWKKDDQEPVVEPITEIPEDLSDLQARVEEEYASSLIPSGSGLRSAKAALPDLKSLLEHFAASSAIGDQVVPQKDIHAILQKDHDGGGFDDSDELVLTILTGVPGSHKDELCNLLTKMAKDESRWAVFRHPLDNAEQFNAGSLQSTLGALVAKKRGKAGSSSRRKMRAIIVTPGFTDTVDLVQAITTHPNTDVRAHLKIGAVTVCIDHTNMFMKDRYTLPKLLDQCGQGWVNNIVFTGPNTGKELAQVQELVRSVNADVALMLAERGQVTRSPDLELILSETAFSNGDLIRARHFSCPGWTHGSFACGLPSPPMMDIVIRFSRPLDKTRFMAKLKGLKGNHTSYPFKENVYHVRGRVAFKGSTDMQELRYSVLSGHSQVAATDKQSLPSENGAHAPPCCVAFVGCYLEEDVLRDWLRQCAPQKPQPKCHATRKSLSRAELRKIHEQHHLEPLPEGWFYNGSRYVCLDGEKSDMHPCIEDFVTDHLQKINAEVDAYNERISQLDYHDLFE